MKRWLRRPYEKYGLVLARQLRTLILFWSRQCRKSTTLGSIAFDEMTRQPGRRVIAASASLLVGSELITKAVSAAEQASIALREAGAMQAAMVQGVASAPDQLQFKVANAETGREYASLSGEDFADLYRAGRLEMRLYHDRNTYSKTQCIAPNPATARGWTGTVVQDESGFIANFADLQAAVGPIIDADPSFKMIYASNLPRDDRHPFFEMTLPPLGKEFDVSDKGNVYNGYHGHTVHRVTLADAYAAGHILYNKRDGKPLSIEDYYAQAINKQALNQNYKLIHEFGGAAAIDLLALDSAQRDGRNETFFAEVENEGQMLQALDRLRSHLTHKPVGLGFDVATTTKQTSNPTSITITERNGAQYIERGTIIWKTRKPQIARERLRQIIQVVADRGPGLKARMLCIDATSEKYFAEETADIFKDQLPVKLVVASEGLHPPGYEKPTNWKTYLGDLYSHQINERRYLIPDSQYIKDDHRLVIKDRGLYVCEPQPDGKHGDTFDSGKLAQHALDGEINGNLTCELL